MGLGLNVDRGRVMGVVITAMEACDLARVLYNKVKALSKRGPAKIVQMRRGVHREVLGQTKGWNKQQQKE